MLLVFFLPDYCNSNLLIHPGYIISQALKSIFHRELSTIFHACNMVSSYISPLLKMWSDRCLSILPLIILFVIYSLHLLGFSLFFHTGCSSNIVSLFHLDGPTLLLKHFHSDIHLVAFHIYYFQVIWQIRG